MLKKFTAVIAILFIVSSVTFAAVAINTYNKANEALESQSETATDAETGLSMNENGEFVDAEGNVIMRQDENGNIVDAEGNILTTAEDLAAAQEEAPAETPAE
jgi:hypothetical protein